MKRPAILGATPAIGIAHEFLSIPDVPPTATGSCHVKGDDIMRHHQKVFDAHRPK